MRGETRLFVGNLPNDIREREVDDLFYKFGRIRDIAVRTPRDKPGYAFIEFEDDRDADDAQYDRDGYNFAGRRIRVEFSNKDAMRGGDRRGDRRGDRDRDRPKRERPNKPANKTDYKLRVTGLPRGATWQDLKDFARTAGGEITFTKVMRDTDEGVVEYATLQDMEEALAKLHNTEMQAREGDPVVVKVESMYVEPASGEAGDKEGKDEGPRDRSRSRSRSRDDGGAEPTARGDEDAEAQGEGDGEGADDTADARGE